MLRWYDATLLGGAHRFVNDYYYVLQQIFADATIYAPCSLPRNLLRVLKYLFLSDEILGGASKPLL